MPLFSPKSYPQYLWTKESMFLQIAPDTPLRRVFDSLPPPRLETGARARGVPAPGARVLVPFGRQRLIGILVGVVAETTVPLHKLKAALEFLDERPVFDPVTFERL